MPCVAWHRACQLGCCATTQCPSPRKYVMRLVLLLLMGLLTALPVWADTRRYVAAAQPGPTCTGNIGNETFNTNPGYDLTWVQETSVGGTPDPDNTTLSLPPPFESESYYLDFAGSNADTSTTHDIGQALAPMYLAVSLYIAAEGLADGHLGGIASIHRTGSSQHYVCLKISQAGGALQLDLAHSALPGFNDCSKNQGVVVDSFAASLHTVYRAELQYEDNGAGAVDDVGWRVWNCGATGTTCSATPDRSFQTTADVATGTTPNKINIGFKSPNTLTIEHYIGFVGFGTVPVCN